MNTRTLAFIALKILGIYCFFQFLFHLPQILVHFSFVFQSQRFGFDFSEGMWALFWAVMIILFGVVAPLALAFFLYAGAGLLSRKMVPDDQLMNWRTPGGAEGVTRAVFQFLGVYALIHWTPALVEVLAQIHGYHLMRLSSVSMHPNSFLLSYTKLISPVLGVVIGLFLIFRPRKFMRLLRLARPMDPLNREPGNDQA